MFARAVAGANLRRFADAIGRRTMRAICYFFVGLAMLQARGATAADLDSSKKFWLDSAFFCKSDAGEFPSKVGEKSDTCDDGDMTLFNGLLCLSGQTIGCEAVRKSQGSDGHWWRSPRRIGWEAPVHDVSFSPDQALGVFAYLIKTRDASALDKWAAWIMDRRPCVVGGGSNCIRGWPRYCTDDQTDKRCTFRPADCAWFAAVAKYLDRSASVCPGVLSVETFVAGSVTLNGPGFPLHLAAVQLYLIKSLGIHNDNVRLAEETFKMRGEPKNAFFAYLREGNTDRVANLTLDVCPSSERPSRRRFQWAWERTDREQAWLDSMYWDCIFMASLLGR